MSSTEPVDHRPGSITVETALTVDVTLLAERTVYGRLEYLVTPLKGHGRKWVHASRFTPQVEA